MTQEEIERAIITLTLHSSRFGEQLCEIGERSGALAERVPTLRDQFAMAALNGYIIACDTVWRERYDEGKDDGDDVPTLTEYAQTAYRIADAMLAAREPKPAPDAGTPPEFR